MASVYKGEIKWLELRSPTEADPMSTKLCITYPEDPNGLQVELQGYGTGEAKLSVRQADPELDSALSELVGTFDLIAKAVVWASPRTIANLVYETVYGQ